MGSRDAVVAPHMPLRLVPEVLDTVDVVVRVSEEFAVIDPVMMELGHIQHMILPEAIGVDDAVRSERSRIIPINVRDLASGIMTA